MKNGQKQIEKVAMMDSKNNPTSMVYCLVTEILNGSKIYTFSILNGENGPELSRSVYQRLPNQVRSIFTN